jgi:hypothetical protein
MRTTAAVVILALVADAGAADYPKIGLSTKNLKLTVYPPDAEKGFYRGSRFCWGGVLGDVEVGGFKLFHAWKDKHDPTNNDDIIGPVIEFGQDSPLGYADAKEGETFVKIGVGELIKPKETKYSFFTNYKVANPGVWKVKHLKKADAFGDDMEMRQTLNSKTGYSYHFVADVSLFDTDKTTIMHVKYELINFGTKMIATDVYNHNFFNVDKQQIGPKYRLGFEKFVEATKDSVFGDRAKVFSGALSSAIEFPKPLAKEAAFGRVVNEDDKKPYDYGFNLIYEESDKKWVRVNVLESWPDEQKRKKFQVWSIGTVMCPEPFYDISLEPGESVKWVTSYEFVTSKKD